MFVMNLDEARTSTVDLGLTPDRSNIRRVVRAHDLVNSGHVNLQAKFGDDRVYQVISQNDPSMIYTVLRNGKVQCNCPDNSEHCKHGLSVLLQEERAHDEAWIREMEAYETDRFASYPEQFELR
jgi:uncharacterized Zn finger protein